jgi:hypothetical protein
MNAIVQRADLRGADLQRLPTSTAATCRGCWLDDGQPTARRESLDRAKTHPRREAKT